MLAVRRALDCFGMTMPLTIEKVGTPDPREPCRKVAHLLWSYQGTEAQPALPAPPQAITQKVATLAQSPYGLQDWGAKCHQLATSLSLAYLPSLLATMVHPPQCPQPEREAGWILRHQVAAAMISIAALTSPANPIANTTSICSNR